MFRLGSRHWLSGSVARHLGVPRASSLGLVQMREGRFSCVSTKATESCFFSTSTTRRFCSPTTTTPSSEPKKEESMPIASEVDLSAIRDFKLSNSNAHEADSPKTLIFIDRSEGLLRSTRHPSLTKSSEPSSVSDQPDNSSTKLPKHLFNAKKTLYAWFMPLNYPQSVTKDFWPFQTLLNFQAVLGSAMYVFSMSALLRAVQQTTAPELSLPDLPSGVEENADLTSEITSMTPEVLSAGASWAIKDGLGFLATLFATRGLATQLDIRSKLFYVSGSLLFSAGTLMEIMTPLIATAGKLGEFIFLGAIGNMLKGIGMMLQGSTRASFYRHFVSPPIQHSDPYSANSNMSAGGKLVDLTAKCHSQSVMSFITGTALGVSLSSLLSTADFSTRFLTLGSLVVLYNTFCYQSIKRLHLRTMNAQRCRLVCRSFFQNVQAPLVLSLQNSFSTSPPTGYVRPFFAFLEDSEITAQLHNPSKIAKSEVLFSMIELKQYLKTKITFSKSSPCLPTYDPSSFKTFDAVSDEIPVVFGAKLLDTFRCASDLEFARRTFGSDLYALNIIFPNVDPKCKTPSTEPKVHNTRVNVALHANSEPMDQLKAYFHAQCLLFVLFHFPEQLTSSINTHALIHTSHLVCSGLFPSFLDALKAQHWDLESAPLFSVADHRFQWL